MSRDYYNRRIGINGERPRLGIVEAAGQIARAHGFMEDNAYLQRSFGYFCVDARDVAGRDGYGLRDPFYLATGIKFEGSLDEAIKSADEVVLFTLLEFVHDHVAKPVRRARTRASARSTPRGGGRRAATRRDARRAQADRSSKGSQAVTAMGGAA